MFKKSLVIVIALGVLIAFMAVRTHNFGAAQSEAIAAINIDWDEQKAAQRLAKSITFKTISSGDGSVDDAAFEAMHAYLKQTYPLVFSQLSLTKPLSQTLLFKWHGKDPSQAPIMLIGHQDVVPVIPGTEDEWHQPPFGGVIANGYIWGRGALDDKVGVIGILEAAERLLSEGWQPPRDIYLGFGHDEEVGGKGAVAMANWLKERDIQLAFLLDEGGVIANGMLPGVNKSVALIGPAEKGYLSLVVTAKSEGGHSSMPPKQTASGILAEAIIKLEEERFPANLDSVTSLIKGLGAEQPYLQRFMFANSWLFASLLEYGLSSDQRMNPNIRTTTAVTMLSGSIKDNVLPIEAKAVVNFRILPGETIETVLAEVKRKVAHEAINVSIYDAFGSNPSKVAPVTSSGYKTLSKVIRQVRPDVIVAPKLVTGATDARHFEGVSDASFRFSGMDIDPEQASGLHGTNERLGVESFGNAIKVYYLLLKAAGDL